MIRKITLLLVILFFALCISSWAQEKPKTLYPVTGTIEEINTQNNSFVIVTKDGGESTILTNSKTSFSKNMIIVKFKDFKVGDSIVVSTEDESGSQVTAVGIFDSETAFLLLTGQGTSMEYEGKIVAIKGNIVTTSTAQGEKKFNITPKTMVVKNLKSSPISSFVAGDEFYAQATFPGEAKHEPKLIEPSYFKDPISYVSELLTGAHGPMVLRGVVTDVTEQKSSFKIGNEKVLANKHTVLLVPVGFKGLADLKGKSVLVYSITNPIPGRTYIAAAVLVEEALPVVRQSLARVAVGDNEAKIVASGKIVIIDDKKNTVSIEDKAGKQILLNLGNCFIEDVKEPARKNLSIKFLRVGDVIQAEGYDTARLKTIYLREKSSESVSRNVADLNVYFFADLLGYLQSFKTGGVNAYTFLSEKEQNQSVRAAESGGFQYFTAAYKKLIPKTKNNLLLCSGNFLYGTPISESTRGEAVIECLNNIGLKAAVLGNQDFFVGKDQLLKLIKKANFPILGCNVIAQGTTNLLPGLKPYVVIELNGIKVGILGLVGSDIPSLVPKSCIEGISFNDPRAALIQYYSKVESESDVVLILANQSFYDNLLMSNDFENILPNARKKPVFIIGGESRSTSASFEPVKANDILLLEAGTKGRYLGLISMGFMKDFTEANYAYYVQTISPGVVKDADPAMQKLIDGFSGSMPAKYAEVLGKATVWVSRAKHDESGMGDLVTDALLKKSGAEVSLYNGKHLRNDIFEGDITYGLLYTAIPYDFKMNVLELTGKDLKEVLEKSLISDEILQVGGIKIVYKKSAPMGQKIQELTIGGKPVSDTQVYKIATTSFLAGGGEGYNTFTKGKVLQEGAIVRDIVADYIKELKEVKMGPPERIVAQ